MTCPTGLKLVRRSQPIQASWALLDGAGARRCVCKMNSPRHSYCWLLDFTRTARLP